VIARRPGFPAHRSQDISPTSASSVQPTAPIVSRTSSGSDSDLRDGCPQPSIAKARRPFSAIPRDLFWPPGPLNLDSRSERAFCFSASRPLGLSTPRPLDLTSERNRQSATRPIRQSPSRLSRDRHIGPGFLTTKLSSRLAYSRRQQRRVLARELSDLVKLLVEHAGGTFNVDGSNDLVIFIAHGS